MNRSGGVWICLLLVGWSLPAPAQGYCSRWAAIACRLLRNGMRLLVVPVWPGASG